jgi:hyaluronan synthase
MAKREFGPIIAAFAVLYYLVTARQLVAFSAVDLVLRCLVGLLYNVLRNPHRLPSASLKWVIPGIVFYHVPLPAVHVWSILTLTADGWGTSMRASGERAKRDSVREAWWENGFFVVWMGIVAGSAARWLMAQVLTEMSHVSALFFLTSSITGASYVAWRLTIATTS